MTQTERHAHYMIMIDGVPTRMYVHRDNAEIFYRAACDKELNATIVLAEVKPLVIRHPVIDVDIAGGEQE